VVESAVVALKPFQHWAEEEFQFVFLMTLIPTRTLNLPNNGITRDLAIMLPMVSNSFCLLLLCFTWTLIQIDPQ
jgi:hypothetical protein